MPWRKVLNHRQNQVRIQNNLKFNAETLKFRQFLDKVFSYLSPDEVERMKAEEERKIANLSPSDMDSLGILDNSDDESMESQPSRLELLFYA